MYAKIGVHYYFIITITTSTKTSWCCRNSPQWPLTMLFASLFTGRVNYTFYKRKFSIGCMCLLNCCLLVYVCKRDMRHSHGAESCSVVSKLYIYCLRVCFTLSAVQYVCVGFRCYFVLLSLPTCSSITRCLHDYTGTWNKDYVWTCL